ncbi:hypothetical protein [Streptomyces cucumeris]|uniref:hypothetical protein n=1 Tax=Streptomyces cucumeris TaxID=2962890 RepID=UPI0020C8D7FC|nr:hypothetical protein [Streptomyces sp. NEAU-Y11]MCP9209532.1 hypothetical protein [Streptomyces sp. NEAU-Y11]
MGPDFSGQEDRGRTLAGEADIPDLGRIAERHAKGESLAALANELGVSSRFLRSRLREIRYGEIAKRYQIIERYTQEQEPATSIAKDLRARGVSIDLWQVYDILKKAGVPRRKGGGAKCRIPDLSDLARRHARGRGESLVALADEVGVHPDTLRIHLREARKRKKSESSGGS